MRAKPKGYGTLNAPEAVYARAKTAGWLLKSLELTNNWDSSFFECLQWVTGGLRRPLQNALKEFPKNTSKSEIVAARNALKELLGVRQDRLARELEDLCEEHACLEGVLARLIKRECAMAHKHSARPLPRYRTALKRLEQTFGLHAESLTLCEFVFINQNYSVVEGYFEDHLDVYRYVNRRILAHMLDMKPERLQSCASELAKSGLLEDHFGNQLRLKDCLLSFWESDGPSTNDLFSRPLCGNVLPLDSFQVPQDDVAHARKLLEQASKKPVHILLYGPPGTGKSTFAYNLARSCAVKAWSVISREGDSESDRRASLTACLHVAARHKGAFVLVDEAERLLDTDWHFGRETKDKAWLNDFLEQPEHRVVWITNQVEHIDPAVRRRFTFSIHFEKLGARERSDIWRQILAHHRISKRLDSEQIDMLAKNYTVEAALIHNAVSQAKDMYKGKKEFLAALERVLRSQTTLQRSGRRVRIKPQAVSDFTLDGVCLEGSAASLVEKSCRVDSAMREGGGIRPGSGTMLFYGPPGTGKTALARYLAKKMDRECVVKRASDLLSKYVGESEQLVADAFRSAEHEGAVLIIDEADTFLHSRDKAQQTWETGLVNEFLTALEECRGFCICTTNRRASLDAAAIRRFSHKVAFTYAKPAQIEALYQKMLSPLCAGPFPQELQERLLGMTCLTPGDFHAVHAQYDSLFTDPQTVTHKTLVDALAKEQSLKTESRERRIGFVPASEKL
ncbi:AAA family ATPase [Desulfovibrio sp. OttesenSCG-928-G15]|nr:AAA family ATPase [Desulfovibrio sp. OttesenSCG-928-G15]